MNFNKVFTNVNTAKISKLLKQNFDLDLNTSKLSETKLHDLSQRVAHKIAKIKNSRAFHESEKNPVYLSLLMLENYLNLYKKELKENEDPMQAYDHDADRNSAYCGFCGDYHSGSCPKEEQERDYDANTDSHWDQKCVECCHKKQDHAHGSEWCNFGEHGDYPCQCMEFVAPMFNEGKLRESARLSYQYQENSRDIDVLLNNNEVGEILIDRELYVPTVYTDIDTDDITGWHGKVCYNLKDAKNEIKKLISKHVLNKINEGKLRESEWGSDAAYGAPEEITDDGWGSAANGLSDEQLRKEYEKDAEIDVKRIWPSSYKASNGLIYSEGQKSPIGKSWIDVKKSGSFLMADEQLRKAYEKDEIDDLIYVIGKKSFDILKNGGYLCKWSGSVPSNWYVTGDIDSGSYAWHSDENNPRNVPNLKLFDVVQNLCSRDKKVFKLKDEILSESIAPMTGSGNKDKPSKTVKGTCELTNSKPDSQHGTYHLEMSSCKNFQPNTGIKECIACESGDCFKHSLNEGIKMPKVTARKFGGDDAYSWAVFRSDKSQPMYTGLNKGSLNHYRKLVQNMIDKEYKITESIDYREEARQQIKNIAPEFKVYTDKFLQMGFKWDLNNTSSSGNSFNLKIMDPNKKKDVANLIKQHGFMPEDRTYRSKLENHKNYDKHGAPIMFQIGWNKYSSSVTIARGTLGTYSNNLPANIKLPKVTAKKHEGDDDYSWAVFRSDQNEPVVTGLGKYEVNHYKKITQDAINKQYKVTAVNESISSDDPMAYGVRYTIHTGRSMMPVEKEKFFKSQQARNKFVNQIEKTAKFLEFTSWSNPETAFGSNEKPDDYCEACGEHVANHETDHGILCDNCYAQIYGDGNPITENKQMNLLDGLDKLYNQMIRTAKMFQTKKDPIGFNMVNKDLGNILAFKDLIADKQYAEAHALCMTFDPSLISKIHGLMGKDFFKLIKKHAPRYYKKAIFEAPQTRPTFSNSVANKLGRLKGAWDLGRQGQHLGSDWHKPTSQQTASLPSTAGVPNYVLNIVQAIQSLNLTPQQKSLVTAAVYKGANVKAPAAKSVSAAQVKPVATQTNTAAQAQARPSTAADSKFYRNAGTPTQNVAKTVNPTTAPTASTGNANGIGLVRDAISGLVNLGYKINHAKEMINKTLEKDPSSVKDLDTLIRKSLQNK